MPFHIGDLGTVLTPLAPQGFARVGGERVDARAEVGTLEPNEAVVVVGGGPVGLVVRKVEFGFNPQTLPNYGQRVFASHMEREGVAGEKEVADKEAWLLERRRHGLLLGPALGVAAAASALKLLWTPLMADSPSPWVRTALFLVGGALWGLALFRGLDETLLKMEHGYTKVTLPSVCLALIGTVGGLYLGLPHFGLAGGLALAGLGALALGGILPGLMLLAEAKG